jgi:hypothetical protein
MEGRTSWESHKRTRHLINTKRKQANRSIFGGATRQTSYRALQHPVTRVITDDATQMLGIIDNTRPGQAALRRETRHVRR